MSSKQSNTEEGMDFSDDASSIDNDIRINDDARTAQNIEEGDDVDEEAQISLPPIETNTNIDDDEQTERNMPARLETVDDVDDAPIPLPQIEANIYSYGKHAIPEIIYDADDTKVPSPQFKSGIRVGGEKETLKQGIVLGDEEEPVPELSLHEDVADAGPIPPHYMQDLEKEPAMIDEEDPVPTISLPSEEIDPNLPAEDNRRPPDIAARPTVEEQVDTSALQSELPILEATLAPQQPPIYDAVRIMEENNNQEESNRPRPCWERYKRLVCAGKALFVIALVVSIVVLFIDRQNPSENADPLKAQTDVPSSEPSPHMTMLPSPFSTEQISDPVKTSKATTDEPTTSSPSKSPHVKPSKATTDEPTTLSPSQSPTVNPIEPPTNEPTTSSPSKSPSVKPSEARTDEPTTSSPSQSPTANPIEAPTNEPSPVSPFWKQVGQNINGGLASDQLGHSTSLSADGMTMAIGAIGSKGYVRVFRREDNGLIWVQLGQTINGEGGRFGWSVSLSANGNALAIGAPFNSDNGSQSGQAKVYTMDVSRSSWKQLGQSIDGTATNRNYGWSVSLSADGTILAVGAYRSDGNGVNSGSVAVYQNEEGNSLNWSQMGQTLYGEEANDQAGVSVTLSADGKTLAIGANGNDGNGLESGHVRVFGWDEAAFNYKQIGGSIEGEASHDGSGYSVALSADGSTLAIGARFDNKEHNSGYARVYIRVDGTIWEQRGGGIDGEAAPVDYSGQCVALSDDGMTIAIGAPRYGELSGYARVYRWDESAMNHTQIGQTMRGNVTSLPYSGVSVSLSGDGNTVAIGAPGSDGDDKNSGQAQGFNIDY